MTASLSYIKWVGQNRTDTFTDGPLQVDHTYRISAIEGEGAGTVVHTIKVTNTGSHKTLLKGVKILVDLDDTGTRWDAYLCDIYATPIDPLGESLSFGDIVPGGSYSQTYRWTASSLVGNVDEDFDIKFNLIPVYKVVYDKSNAFTSTCVVSGS